MLAEHRPGGLCHWDMTAAGEAVAAEIASNGPMSFHRFMEIALYHPEHGYYRRARDPFGKEGDFFTAEQIQPVFGILIAGQIRELYRGMGEPRDFTVVELGAGRGEMAGGFSEWRYLPIEAGSEGMQGEITGVVFANEFFDALPVHVAVYRDGAFHEQNVALRGGRFIWETGARVSPEVEEYLRRYWPPPEEGRWYEVNLEAVQWMEQIGRSLCAGYVVAIDYGYTREESIRYPAGTLMGYRKHIAREDVLEDPGAQDITAHVNFTALVEAGERAGLRVERFETLARTLLRAGEPDQFASALQTGGPDEPRRRLQLKTLLFGMGEAFRVLLMRRGVSERPQKRKGPGDPGP